MIIFPSYLRHWVYPNEEESERVSIAFNIRYSSAAQYPPQPARTWERTGSRIRFPRRGFAGPRARALWCGSNETTGSKKFNMS